MGVRSLHENRDILHVGQAPSPGPRGEGHEAEVLDARRQEVGLSHSSDEADEQSRASGSGAGGAKGRDQGERGPAKHAPDTEPDQHVTCAGPHTAGRARAAYGVPLSEQDLNGFDFSGSNLRNTGVIMNKHFFNLY